MNSKRNVWLWVLYDFANSVVAVVFFLYFAQWVVIDMKIPDLYFNFAFTGSALLLLFTVPITGVLLDVSLRRITGLRVATIGTAIFYTACALSAVSGNGLLAIIFFTLGLYFYLLSFTFYTPLINDISLPEKRGKVSGTGIAANYVGQIAGLVLALPFANGHFHLFSGTPRSETLLPAIILFALLSLPMLLFFREPKKEASGVSLKAEIRSTIQKTRELFLFKGVFLFVLSYFLFNDAILTAINNFPVFLEQVWKISDTTKTYLLLAIMVTSALVGYFGGFLADKLGHKKVLMWIICGWLVIFPSVAFFTNFTLFSIVAIIMGVWYGATWAVSRSTMAYLCPDKRHNLAFAYFGLVERASSFVGPIIWGLVVGNLVSYGPNRYRIAILAITGFIALSIWTLTKVKGDREVKAL